MSFAQEVANGFKEQWKTEVVIEVLRKIKNNPEEIKQWIGGNLTFWAFQYGLEHEDLSPEQVTQEIFGNRDETINLVLLELGKALSESVTI